MTSRAHVSSPHAESVGRVFEPLDIAAAPAVYLVDIRPSSERYSAIGFIPGSRALANAEAIAQDEGAMRAFFAQFEADATIVLVCASGRRSAALAEQLAPHTAQLVGTLRGGTIGWGACGLPLCGTRTPAQDTIPHVASLEKLPRALLITFAPDALDRTLDGRENESPRLAVQRVIEQHSVQGKLTVAGAERAVEHIGELARRAGYRLSHIQESLDAYRAVIAKLAMTTPRAPSR